MNFARRPVEELNIEITPLIDVVFLLLIFFMVTTTFATQSGIGVQLPEAQAKERPAAEPISITIEADGTYHLDDREIAAADLPQALASLNGRRDPSTVVVIRADKEVSHGHVVQAMDAARTTGFRRLAIATEPTRR